MSRGVGRAVGSGLGAGSGAGVSVGLLGPMQVLRDGQDVTPPGVRLRALLCRLAVDPGRRVSSDELAEAVW
ncbi:MAG: AfsR/SARP family transcriptional regulator, partial [Janthinobacterium lividum]